MPTPVKGVAAVCGAIGTFDRAMASSDKAHMSKAGVKYRFDWSREPNYDGKHSVISIYISGGILFLLQLTTRLHHRDVIHDASEEFLWNNLD